MKQARKRLLPSIQAVICSTRSATHAAEDTIAFVDASNRWIARMESRADKLVRKKVANVANRKPASRSRPRLDELMAQVPPGTRFEEIDFGPPVGREVL